MNNEIYIKKVFSNGKFIFLFFDNNEIKVLEKNMLPDNKHIRKIKKDEIWQNVKTNGFCLLWPKYKIYGQAYDAGADVLYSITRKATKDDLIQLLSLQAQKKPLKQIKKMLISFF